MLGVFRASRLIIKNYRRRARTDTKLDKYVKPYQEVPGFAEDISYIDYANTLRPSQNDRHFPHSTFVNAFFERKCVNF